ncbi:MULTISPECIES: TA system toxin CbtA family protein [Xenorhabdus]|uniref:Toxin-antitoxin protein n=3 Tax=Xenorhabdus TaxID=626 RepID=A0A2G0QD99_XENHO|nr:MULTISPECIES: TA system toxin CbtA family protein [Xenorhabdus]AOM41300.1 toxin-antitoxin protein [Xenorhabdus hominickii]MDE1480150.1 toxin [Xenorhabdus bovienii]MDE9452456.1 toxin [Xenorhabdus bovienii]MDE9511846.1 toxin [Xenorhabdus bovienii]MDE9523488.1 toxin [Xenorhabdus bovienii]
MTTLRLTVWQVIAAALLKRHFGLSLTDTALCETDTVAALIARGVRPSEAINELVDKYDLIRLNTQVILRSTPYLDIHDELTVIFDSGLADRLFRQTGQ